MAGGRRRRGAEEWRELVGAWRAGGQSRDRFARERGVKSTTLGWWASEFARRDREEPVGRKATSLVEPTTFLPVRVIGGMTGAPSVTDVSNAARVELVLDGGRVLRVPVGVDVTWVGSVVAALEQVGRC